MSGAARVTAVVCFDCDGRRYWRGAVCPGCRGVGRRLETVQPAETFRIALHEWAVAGWRSEVQNRPLVNIHRKRLDDFWREAIRKAGGDPGAIVGPSHDELLGAECSEGQARATAPTSCKFASGGASCVHTCGDPVCRP